MTAAGSMIGAAVDVGSNSVHLLVARVRDDGGGIRLEHVHEESEFLGLGDTVDRLGRIPAADVGRLIDVLRGYCATALAHGAAAVELVGTAPLRRATNGQHVASEVETALGQRLRILAEREEGALTFLGVTGGQAPTEALLVADIGGGSAEAIFAAPGTDLTVVSLPTGAASLTAQVVEHDPPTDEEIGRLLTIAAELFAGLPAAAPARAIFTGGTPTKLARLAPLTEGEMDEVLALVRAEPSEVIARRYSLKLLRARQLAAGAALVAALLARYGVRSAEVSEASLRDGLVLRRLGRVRG